MAGLEALDSAVSFVAVPVIVDGRDKRVGVCKCLVETLDAAEVKRDTRDDDKMLVGELRAVFQGKRVLLRSESAGGLVVEFELGVESTLQVNAKIFLVFETSSDKSPTGLVVVPLSRVDDGNIWTSSGISAGTDLMYAWVSHVYSDPVADYMSKSLEYDRQTDEHHDPYGKIWDVPGAV